MTGEIRLVGRGDSRDNSGVMDDKPKKPKRRRTLLTNIGDLAAYAAVRVAICIVQALPRPLCERGARRLSAILANRLRIRREVVRDNLRLAFPAYTVEQRRETARAMWEHLLLMVVEIGRASCRERVSECV